VVNSRIDRVVVTSRDLSRRITIRDSRDGIIVLRAVTLTLTTSRECHPQVVKAATTKVGLSTSSSRTSSRKCRDLSHLCLRP